MGEADHARRAESARERMSSIAEELARRTTGGYLRERASEATMEKAKQLKERTLESPMALGIVGGMIGAAVGATLAQRREKRHAGGVERIRYGEYGERFGSGAEAPEHAPREAGEGAYEAAEEAGGAKAKLSEARGTIATRASEAAHGAKEVSHRAKERVSDVSLRLREKASSMRERVPSAHDVRVRASREWEERPLLLSLLALVVGAIFAMFLPVGTRERRLLQPAKEKVREGVEKLGATAEETIAAEGGEAPAETEARTEPAATPVMATHTDLGGRP